MCFPYNSRTHNEEESCQKPEVVETQEQEEDHVPVNEGNPASLDDIFEGGSSEEEEDKVGEEEGEAEGTSKPAAEDSEAQKDGEGGEKSGEEEEPVEPETVESLTTKLTELSGSVETLNERLADTQDWGSKLSTENGLLKKEVTRLQRREAGEPEETDDEKTADADLKATQVLFAQAEKLTAPVYEDYFEIVGKAGDEVLSPFRNAIKEDPKLIDECSVQTILQRRRTI